jgi:phosphatidylglycerol---prolipoprotein diacylglyceryl transferase
MRSILFTIPLDGRLDLGALGKVPLFGVGVVLAVWSLIGLVYLALQMRRSGRNELGIGTLVVWGIVAIAIFKAPDIKAIPVYGYGTMLFLGFLASASFAAWRIRREGADGEIAWDASMWIFVSGIFGARVYYVATHSDRFFGIDPLTGQGRTLAQTLKALVNLPDGGLVLYGGVILAPVAYFLYCRHRRVSPLALADLAITSIFIGLMFGRLGCFLHGCCYGDLCTLPWGVSFPQGSVPFDALVSRGLLAADQPRSVPLHPSQLYDSLNGVLLALLTYFYYPFRRRTGEVLAIGWMLYPINRFLIEFLRSDEPAVWGTPFTGAQLLSLGMFGVALGFYIWLQRRPPGRQALMISGGE